MKTVGKIIATISCLTCFAVNAAAVSQGSVGATSTGSSDISLTVPEFVRISGIRDFALGNWSGTGDMTDNDNVIISGNDDQGTPSYQIVFTGNGAAGIFTLARQTLTPDSPIPYAVCFDDDTTPAGCINATATLNTGLTGLTGINQTLDSATENGNIRITVAESDLDDAPRGTYQGTLTIVVTPE